MKNKTNRNKVIKDILINDLKEENLSYKNNISELIKTNRDYLDRLHSIDEMCRLLFCNPQLSLLTKNKLIAAIHDLSTVSNNNGK